METRRDDPWDLMKRAVCRTAPVGGPPIARIKCTLCLPNMDMLALEILCALPQHVCTGSQLVINDVSSSYQNQPVTEHGFQWS